MPTAKEREELKMRLQKISQSKEAKAPAVHEPPVIPEQSKEPQSLEELEEQFAEKRKALMEKEKTPLPQQEEEVEIAGSTEQMQLAGAIEEYQNNGKFRVELIYQLVQINKSLKELVESLKK